MTDIVPKDTPAHVVEHRLEGDGLICPECGETMVEIGKEVRRTLVIKKPELSIREDWYYTYMWLYRTSGDAEHPIVLYDYKPNRKIENAEEFLGDFRGYLHADGYPGCHNLPERITVVGCLAHARRKFADALKVLPMEQRRGSSAAEALQYFAKIAAWEKKLEGVTPEKRYKKRQEKENRLDPYAYLLYIFRTAPQLDRTSENWVLPLLPENAPDACKVNI